ncbi:MAG TPA: PfkB family carbohydrate kinase [Acidobacteriota bacterium]|nr:PfkB family carbohydrate kinase [Acidobacteriota bacterium]
MESVTDILGLGAVAVDDFVYVESYPAPNSKVRVVDRERQCGGLTGTALVAAARLGCRCSYAGVTGTDDASHFALAALAGEGVRIDSACRRADRRVYHSTIIVDLLGRRTLLSDGRNVQPAGEDWPEESTIRSCKVLFVDHTAMSGMIRAARIARSQGIPVVADLERVASENIGDLMSLVDHLIVPEEFARAVTGKDEPDRAAAGLWTGAKDAVVVTCGEAGCWYIGPDCGPTHREAYRADVVDTTGCGDVFHGAYAAGLVLGLDLAARIRLASAAAALKAARRGGQAGCPTMAEVERFIREHSPR